MTILLFFLTVLLAGTLVVAWSTAVAPTDSVPVSHDRHLHGLDTHLRLPPPPL